LNKHKENEVFLQKEKTTSTYAYMPIFRNGGTQIFCLKGNGTLFKVWVQSQWPCRVFYRGEDVSIMLSASPGSNSMARRKGGQQKNGMPLCLGFQLVTTTKRYQILNVFGYLSLNLNLVFSMLT
jgi:hypothetical protein